VPVLIKGKHYDKQPAKAITISKHGRLFHTTPQPSRLPIYRGQRLWCGRPCGMVPFLRSCREWRSWRSKHCCHRPVLCVGKATGKVTVLRVVRSEAEWKQKLSPISFDVTRREGTERPYSGSTWNNHDHGFYRCICCDNAIFSSETKFESGTGWPSFWQPIAKENVIEITDRSLGMERTAVSCRECDAHLGHVFDDGPRPTGLRYCMNSAAMRFVKTA
jgi:methionine-R-sulfoxide reductase